MKYMKSKIEFKLFYINVLTVGFSIIGKVSAASKLSVNSLLT